MIIINEFLSNPVGTDASGEWVELYNSGQDAADLSGWRIQNSSGKSYVLDQTAPPGGYLVLHRSQAKLTLRNSGEDLKLFDPAGGLRSEASFIGSAPEGKSIGFSGGHYVLMQPTPGAENSRNALSFPALEYPLDRPLAAGLGFWSMTGLALGIGALLAATAIFLYIHTHEEKDLVR